MNTGGKVLMIPRVQFVGFSNSGKTMIVRKFIAIMKSRGYRVAAVKHAAHHGYEMDAPGTDSWHYFAEGADQVVVAAGQSISFHNRLSEELSLDDICKQITGVDFIIVEGYKGTAGPKIEVFRNGYSPERLSLGPDLLGIVSDISLDCDVPLFSYEQIEQLADLLEKTFLVSKE